METYELSIRGHLLRWSDTVIQISNISMVSTAEVPASRVPMWLLVAAGICGLFGIWLLDVNSKMYYPNEAMQVFGVLAIIASIGWFLTWWFTRNTKDKTYLNLALNSGNVYSFLFTDKAFMLQVLQVFANIFESDPSVDAAVSATGSDNATVIGSITINMHGNEIRDSSGALINVVPK